MDELAVVGQQVEIAQSSSGLMDAFADFLRLDVANGDASMDTIRGYKTQVALWVEWCSVNGVQPAQASPADIKGYRLHLVTNGYKASSVAHKLTIIRRFYAAAVDNGLRPDNPAAGIKPPRDKRAQDDFHYLNEVDYTLLLRAVGKAKSEKNLRDKAIIALMGLQGLRTVEIERANVGDMNISGENVSMLIRGRTTTELSIFARTLQTSCVSTWTHVREWRRTRMAFRCSRRVGTAPAEIVSRGGGFARRWTST